MMVRTLVLIAAISLLTGCGIPADLIRAHDAEGVAISKAEENLTTRFKALLDDDYERWRAAEWAKFEQAIDQAKDENGRVPADLIYSLLDDWANVDKRAAAHREEMLAKWDVDLEDLRTARRLHAAIGEWLGVLGPFVKEGSSVGSAR
jgi:hypothetical protein